jgi:hypothetical protein
LGGAKRIPFAFILAGNVTNTSEPQFERLEGLTLKRIAWKTNYLR